MYRKQIYIINAGKPVLMLIIMNGPGLGDFDA
jgi:hypothetical protein